MSYIVKSDFIDKDEHFYKQGDKYPIEGVEVDDERINLLTGKGDKFAYIVLNGDKELTQDELLEKFYKDNTGDVFKELLDKNEIDYEGITKKDKLFELILDNNIDVLTD